MLRRGEERGEVAAVELFNGEHVVAGARLNMTLAAAPS